MGYIEFMKTLLAMCKKLKTDLDRGIWEPENADILDQSSIDAGYVIITAGFKNYLKAYSMP